MMSLTNQIRLHSLPSSKGRRSAIAISIVVHCLTFLLVVLAGIIGDGGLLFWTGASVFTTLLVYQHRIVKHDDLAGLLWHSERPMALPAYYLLFLLFLICFSNTNKLYYISRNLFLLLFFLSLATFKNKFMGELVIKEVLTTKRTDTNLFTFLKKFTKMNLNGFLLFTWMSGSCTTGRKTNLINMPMLSFYLAYQG